jgi:hypothetical protein
MPVAAKGPVRANEPPIRIGSPDGWLDAIASSVAAASAAGSSVAAASATGSSAAGSAGAACCAAGSSAGAAGWGADAAAHPAKSRIATIRLTHCNQVFFIPFLIISSLIFF